MSTPIFNLDDLAELASKFARKHISREIVEAALGVGIPSPFFNVDPVIFMVVDGQRVMLDSILVRFCRTLEHLVEK